MTQCQYVTDSENRTWKVRFAICPAEPDVGLMRDYIEVQDFELVRDPSAEDMLTDLLNDLLIAGEL